MATPVKTARTIISSASLAVGNTSSGTLDLTTKLGALINVRVTNGATGPTVAPTITINTSSDNSAWRLFASVVASTGNSTVTDVPVRIPREVMYVQVSVTGNTGQAVTVEATAQELTSN